MPRTATLDQIKRHEICALLACGASRRDAAEYVDCATTTIANTAGRDPDFAERLRRAECHYALRNLRAINRAATRSWRAGVWALRQHDPEAFGQSCVGRVAPASIARAANREVSASADAGQARPGKTHGQPRSTGGRFLPKSPSVEVSALAAPFSSGPIAVGPISSNPLPAAPSPRASSPDFTRADALFALEQALAIAGLNADQQDQVLASFALLADPHLAARFPDFLAQLASLNGTAGHTAGQETAGPHASSRMAAVDAPRRPAPPVVGQEPPFNPPFAVPTNDRPSTVVGQKPPFNPPFVPSPNAPANYRPSTVVGQKPPFNSPFATPSPATEWHRSCSTIVHVVALVAAILLGLIHRGPLHHDGNTPSPRARHPRPPATEFAPVHHVAPSLPALEICRTVGALESGQWHAGCSCLVAGSPTWRAAHVRACSEDRTSQNEDPLIQGEAASAKEAKYGMARFAKSDFRLIALPTGAALTWSLP